MKTNPVLLEVFKNRFASIAEEMGVTLNRTAFSPNIKERRDFSCALFDTAGDMIAQASHIPVHLGSMPLSVQSALSALTCREGDMIVLNDPYRGGTHLPDVTLVAPVFHGGRKPAFFVANRAHHADLGGMSAGSMPLSRTLHQEGVIIPPLKLLEGGRMDRKILDFILSNVRTPVERKGDFAAQIMANITGTRRLQELAEKVSLPTARFYARALMDYAERIMRQTVEAVPDGVYSFEDVLDGDGFETGDVTIRLTLTVKGDEVVLDFRKSDPQVPGSLNAVRAITLSAVLYVFRSLVREDIPANTGCLRPLRVLTREGTVVDARFPAAVAAGNVETSQRLVDVLLGALSRAIPNEVPAASQGTMNNVCIGGFHPGSSTPFAYYETLGGGMGASAASPGEDAIHSHMTNTLNTPVEALEYAYPLQVTRYGVRRGTGGQGKHRGGDGLVREIRLLADAEVTVLSERRVHRPYGLRGGGPGEAGRNTVTRKGVTEERPGKFCERMRAGDVLRIETPGGGGYGKAGASPAGSSNRVRRSGRKTSGGSRGSDH